MKPRDRYLLYNSINPGISILQGAHHVAQKSNKITLSLYVLRVTSLPLMSLRVKLRFATFPFVSQVSSAAASNLGGCGADIINRSAITVTIPVVTLNISF